MLFAALAAELVTPTVMVQATSACFVSVYLISLAAAARILTGSARLWAVVALLLTGAVSVFSAWYLLVPLAAAAVTAGTVRVSARRRGGIVAPT